MGSPKLMFAMVMVAALADAGALVAWLPLAVAVAVPDWLSEVDLLDPPHAVVIAATRHMAAQNKANLFIVTPLNWTLGETRLSTRIGSKNTKFAVL
jgi:hypothetical protein